ncbi:MAG: hypothetical protein RR839_05565 [Oscillospiraceae bacterium]
MRSRENNVENITYMLICFACFFLIIDLACEKTFYLFEIFFILVFLTVLYKLKINFSADFFNNKEFSFFSTEKVLIALAVYLFVDCINSFYSQNYEYIFEKYKVVLSTLGIGMGIYLYCDEEKKLVLLKKTFFLASSFISLITVLDYVFFGKIGLNYILRFSLRRDYNVYSTAIFVGFVFQIFLILKSNSNMLRKIINLFAINVICLPTMLLSGSRRIMVMLISTACLCLIVMFAQLLRYRKNIFEMISTIGLLSIATAIICLQISGLQNYMIYIYNTPKSIYAPNISKSAEITALERLETASNVGAFQKRKIIWEMGINEFENYTLTQKIFGKGNCYDIVYYNTAYNKSLETAYGGRENYVGKMSAHSFVLADLLNGGFLKLAVSIWLIYEIGKMVVIKFFENPINILAYIIIFSLCIGGDLISNRYGLLYDKILILAIFMLVKEGAKNNEKRWKGVYNHLSSPS